MINSIPLYLLAFYLYSARYLITISHGKYTKRLSGFIVLVVLLSFEDLSAQIHVNFPFVLKPASKE